jgi:hypothetical protein
MPINLTEDSPSATGCSLVPVTTPGAAASGMTHAPYARPSAAFLAQLVATAQGAPQTRTRRRASFDHAAARYAAAARLAPPSAIKVSM